MADSDVTVVVVRNDFERLRVLLLSEAEHAVADAANKIEADIKSGSSPRIASTVRTKTSGSGLTATIGVGDRQRAIHAGFEEFGTVTRAAHPVVVPAAEAARGGFMRDMKKLLDRGL